VEVNLKVFFQEMKKFAPLFALAGSLLLSVNAVPTADLGSRDLIADVINLVGLGLVTHINASITVSAGYSYFGRPTEG